MNISKYSLSKRKGSLREAQCDLILTSCCHLSSGNPSVLAADSALADRMACSQSAQEVQAGHRPCDPQKGCKV